MISNRDKIVSFCSEYLQSETFEDHCFNGLQVEGSEEVSKVACGVSLSVRLIEEAVKKSAQMIFVHHGFFESDIPSPFVLKGVMKKRVKFLLDNDISLVGYHLPLDAHPIIGNNISLANILELKEVSLFSYGFIGNLEKDTTFSALCENVDDKLGVKSISLDFSSGRSIRKIAVSSGSSSYLFEQAANLEADVLLCGDIREDVVRKAEEIGISIIGAGHYNTEKEGVKNLGELVSKEFGVENFFIDIPCKI